MPLDSLTITCFLLQGEWCDFDEKLGESVGIYELEYNFQTLKGQAICKLTVNSNLEQH